MRALLLALVLLLGFPATAGADVVHQWPATGRPQVVRPFDPPAQRWLSGHRGVDLGVAPGSAVLAPADGTVTFSGRVVNREVITLLDGTGRKHSFEPVTQALPAGSRVRRGDVLALVAAGHCAVSCVHWGVRRGEEYVDPLLLLPRPRAVLLPFTVTVGGGFEPSRSSGPRFRPAGPPHVPPPGSAGPPRPHSPTGNRLP